MAITRANNVTNEVMKATRVAAVGNLSSKIQSGKFILKSLEIFIYLTFCYLWSTCIDKHQWILNNNLPPFKCKTKGRSCGVIDTIIEEEPLNLQIGSMNINFYGILYHNLVIESSTCKIFPLIFSWKKLVRACNISYSRRETPELKNFMSRWVLLSEISILLVLSYIIYVKNS